jgi:hypothetical protein
MEAFCILFRGPTIDHEGRLQFASSGAKWSKNRPLVRAIGRVPLAAFLDEHVRLTA